MGLYEEGIKLFGEQRNLTEEEQACINSALEKMSEPTGLKLFDFIDEED